MFNNGQDWSGVCNGIDFDDCCNWDMQYIFSFYMLEIMYMGIYWVYQGFDSINFIWVLISEDFIDGLVLYLCYYFIISIDELVFQFELLYVGIIDGNVWCGEEVVWILINDGLFDCYVFFVKVLFDDVNSFYVIMFVYKDYDFSLLVFCFDDQGDSWSFIVGDLLDLVINDIYIYFGIGDSVFFVVIDGGVYGI